MVGLLEFTWLSRKQNKVTVGMVLHTELGVQNKFCINNIAETNDILISWPTVKNEGKPSEIFFL